MLDFFAALLVFILLTSCLLCRSLRWRRAVPALAAQRPVKRWVISLWLLVVLVASWGLYAVLGDAPDWQRYQMMQMSMQNSQLLMQAHPKPQQLIKQLADFQRQHPDKAKGWYLLGRLYSDTHQYPQAFHSMRLAHRLRPQNIRYEMAYWEAMFLLDHQKLAPKAIKRLHQLAQVPQPAVSNVAINLLAINAFRRHDYHQAITDWQRLLPRYPKGSADAKALLKMIAKAQTARRDRRS